MTRPSISITLLKLGCLSPHLWITKTLSPRHFPHPCSPTSSHLPGFLLPLTSYALRELFTLIGVNDVSKLEVKGLYPPSMCALLLSIRSHSLIPLQLDETDTRNESYICFRRREIKAVRKTRASHVTFSDKLIRLQNELATAFEIANEVIAREAQKKEAAQLQQEVWNQRILFSDLKRKFPTLSTKEDEELLVDKERVPKKPKVEP
jgi:hypothetical protein